MTDEFDEFEDQKSEQIRLAELVCKHKERKLFEQWMQIAYALDVLEDIAAARAVIERDEDPDYAKDRDFQLHMKAIKQEYPILFDFLPPTMRHLAWLAKNASRISYWHRALSVEQRSELTSPAVIRSRYEKNQAPPG